jgi:hypothetical protein
MMKEQLFEIPIIIKAMKSRRLLARLHNTFLCKYCEELIMVVLHYKNSDDVTFMTTRTLTTKHEWWGYCKLGFGKKWGILIIVMPICMASYMTVGYEHANHAF